MGVQIPQGKGAIFGGCPGHSKALATYTGLDNDGRSLCIVIVCMQRWNITLYRNRISFTLSVGLHIHKLR